MYLGLDVSTQGIKAIILKDKIIAQESIQFDDLGYNTKGGVYHHNENVYQNPMMFLEALDLIFEKFDFDLGLIQCISGCAQQHGAVFLSSWPPLDQSLLKSFKTHFSLPFATNWQDTSTKEHCIAMQSLSKRTGSDAQERFTGPQIARISRVFPIEYSNTKHIMLISTFITSVLVGRVCGVDPSDASGMNLMDITTCQWIPELLDYCGVGLKEKLGEINESIHTIDSYFTKYGFSKDCQVVSFTGDNPSTFASFPLSKDDLLISLGTSDTIMFDSDVQHNGHVFRNPKGDGYMGMLCFKNGSLVRQNYNTGNWDTFNELLKRDTNGYIPFFYPNQEILPLKQGIWVFHNQARVDISSIDQELIPKLVVESQLLNMRYFAKKNKGKIICTGGASKNDAILGIMASVFGMPVYRMETENAAALGGCYRAKYYNSDYVVDSAMEFVAEPSVDYEQKFLEFQQLIHEL